MKRLALLLSSLLLFLFSCKNAEKEVPENLIDHDTMVDYVVECWLAESAIHNFGGKYEKQQQETVTFYDDFFKRHNITKEQFIHSLEYYMNDNVNTPIFIEECKQRLEEEKDEYIGE